MAEASSARRGRSGRGLRNAGGHGCGQQGGPSSARLRRWRHPSRIARSALPGATQRPSRDCRLAGRRSWPRRRTPQSLRPRMTSHRRGEEQGNGWRRAPTGRRSRPQRPERAPCQLCRRSRPDEGGTEEQWLLSAYEAPFCRQQSGAGTGIRATPGGASHVLLRRSSHSRRWASTYWRRS